MEQKDSYQERLLLRIEDYEFQDGEGVRDKYMIVLNRNEESAFILHTLTTKQASGFDPKKSGCNTSGNISYFYFAKGEIIGESGFSFKLDTFIFFRDNIRKEALKSFEKYASDKAVIQDVITKPFFKALIDCMLNSMFITPDQADLLLVTRKTL
jgi:hypothetical protein